MTETGGNSLTEGTLLSRHTRGTGSWSIKNDITQDSLESIFEDTEDLFT